MRVIAVIARADPCRIKKNYCKTMVNNKAEDIRFILVTAIID